MNNDLKQLAKELRAGPQVRPGEMLFTREVILEIATLLEDTHQELQRLKTPRTHTAIKDTEALTAVEAIDKARQCLSKLTRGEKRWEMSIPARPDHDPDLIIGEALRLARKALLQQTENAKGTV